MPDALNGTFEVCTQFLNTLVERGEYELARKLAPVIGHHSREQNPAVTDFVSKTLLTARAPEEALIWAKKTQALAPAHPIAQLQLAKCLLANCQELEAEKLIRNLIRSLPQETFLYLELSTVLHLQGRFTEAKEILEKLYRELPIENPFRASAYFALHWHWMQEGRFREAMKAFLSPNKTPDWKFPKGPRPELKAGDDVRGKRVLVIHEAGGAGDEIINLRFARQLHERGARVFWKTNHGFQTLFSRAPGIERVVDSRDLETLEFDLWAATGSLSETLELDLKDLSRKPYLEAHPEFVNKWSRKIPDHGRLRVGLRWEGNMGAETEVLRAVPFDDLRKLLAIPGVDFYSLQRDTGVTDLRPSDPVIDLSEELQSWEDTAAAIYHLDLVITNCTSIAHLSGALGKKTWVYTPLRCFYIWALPSDDSPWYRDVTLFRQSRRREWADATHRIKLRLEETFSAGTRSRSIPTFEPSSL